MSGAGQNRERHQWQEPGSFITLNTEYVIFSSRPKTSGRFSKAELQPPATAGGTDSDADFSEF